LQIQRGRRRAPRVPFYVAKGITRPSAAALVARLESIGLDACIAQDTPLARRAIRGKLWQTTYRPLAGYGIVSIQSLRLLRLVPRHWGLLGLLAPLVIMAGG